MAFKSYQRFNSSHFCKYPKPENSKTIVEVESQNLDGAKSALIGYLGSTQMRVLISNATPSSYYHQGAQLLVSSNLKNVDEIKSLSYQNYLKGKGICFTAEAKSIEVKAFGLEIASRAEAFKLAFQELATKKLGEHGGILPALLLGNRSGLEAKDYEQLKHLGLSHIIAVSGSHFSIFSEVVEKLSKRLRKQKKLVVAFLCISAYMYLLGDNKAALRAYGTSVVGIASKLMGRKLNILAYLLISLFIAVVVSPHCLNDIGFQLSLIGWLTVKLIPLPKWLRSEVLSSLMIGICIFPVSLLFFQDANLLAPLISIVLVPAYLFVQKLGLYLLPALIAQFEIVCNLMALILTSLQKLTDVFSSFQLSININSFAGRAFLIAYFCFILMLLLIKLRSHSHASARKNYFN